jgi:CMP-N-acetylneuraminic acid synthetase
MLDRVLLSSDDLEIIQVARAYGVEARFTRPADLAQDDTPVLPVIRHAVDWLEAHEDISIDVVVLLQPTSPLRTSTHIDAAVDLLLESGADNVVSVQAVPHNFNPVSVMRLDEDGSLKPYIEGELILRRQDKPRIFARNGPAVLAVRRRVIDSGRLYGERVLPYEMTSLESIDIDDVDDLRLVEALISSQQKKTP